MSASRKPRVDDEEDLDDLDDVLDQFSSPSRPTSETKPSTTSPAPKPGPASSSKSPQQVIDGTGDELADDFTAELAKEMESLFKGLGLDPQGIADVASTEPETAEQKANQEKLAAAWEAMLIEGMDGMTNQEVSGRTGTSSASTKPKEGGDFQSRIRSTMNKIKESESGLKSSDSSAPGADSIETLLAQLGGLEGLDGEGEESEEQLQGVLEAMMGQLMSKEVLYEPLKELHEKFPDYLSKHSSTMSAEDKKRYEAQIVCIKGLLVEFEAKGYRDEDEKAREKIVELMGELQTHGSPPEEIMGPLPPGFTMGADGLPNLPSECVVS